MKIIRKTMKVSRLVELNGLWACWPIIPQKKRKKKKKDRGIERD